MVCQAHLALDMCGSDHGAGRFVSAVQAAGWYCACPVIQLKPDDKPNGSSLCTRVQQAPP